MSSVETNSGEEASGSSHPAPISPLVPEILTIPEVVCGVSQIDTVAKGYVTVGDDVSEDKQPAKQSDSGKEAEGEGASVSTQSNREVEFVKKPGEFTTEVFKIEIRNLPRYSGYKVSADVSWIEVSHCNTVLATEKTDGGVRIEASQDQDDAQRHVRLRHFQMRGGQEG